MGFAGPSGAAEVPESTFYGCADLTSITGLGLVTAVGQLAFYEAGMLPQFAALSLNEALVMGLAEQGIRKFVGIFGHGSTDLGEILRA